MNTKTLLTAALLLSITAMTPTAYSQSDGIAAADNYSMLTLQHMPHDEYETVWGGGWYSFKSQGFGFYINGQLTAQSTAERDDFYESLGVGAFGDPVTGSISDFAVLNIGTTFALGGNFGVFAGIGYASVEGYAEKFDPLYILDSDGEYLVRDGSLDDSGVNANAGLMVRIAKVALELGYHSFAKESYLGVGFTF